MGGLNRVIPTTPRIVVAALDTPVLLRRSADYGADELQDALDAAAASVVSSAYGVPTVALLPGKYSITDELSWTSCNLVADAPNTGTRLVWDGANGGTMLTRSGTGAGTLSYGLLSGINFRVGTGTPAVMLDLTAGDVDKHFKLDRLHFRGGDVQIDMAGFINAHWRDLRFDDWGTWAIRIASTRVLATMMIDGFTADNGGVGGQQGFVQIDNTGANVSNLGTFHLKDGRVELNSTYAAGPKALISLKLPNPGNSGVIGLHLEDVTYQDVIAQSGDTLVYLDTTATTLTPSLLLTNVRQSNLGSVVAGSLPAAFPTLPLQANYGVLAINPGMTAGTFSIYSRSDAAAAFNIRRASETVDRLAVDPTGKASWSDGTNAADTNLYRRAADQLKTDDKLLASAGIGVGNSAAATTLGTVTKKIEVFDASGSSLGYLPVYDAIT